MTDVELGQARQAARPLRIIARFFRRSWQALVVVVLAIALGVAAYLSPGLVQADVHLDEGTVYVANRENNLLGTVNAQIDELSAATGVGDSRFQILQHENQVEAFLPQSGNVHPYLPARNILDQATKMPSNGVIQQVGSNLLVFDQEKGSVWHGTVDEVLDVDIYRDEADLEVGEFGVATLTTTGKVIGLNPNTGTLLRPQGEALISTPVPIAFDPERRSFELSAVGDTAVVLDRHTAQVWVEGMPKAFTIGGQSQAMLLPPVDRVLRGEENIRGVVATPAGLLGISSNGVKSLSGRMDLRPARPVQVGDCLYGAFAEGPEEAKIVKRCPGEEPIVTALEHLTTDGSELQFQVNRTTVALNDMANGTVWLVNRGTVILPEDWEHVRPIVESDDAEFSEGDPAVMPDRNADNRKPMAKDDQLGARAAQSTILTVLDNDTDPDGDILTITVPQTEIEQATLQLVRGGAGLQITVNSGVEPGTVLEVPYTVHDGRGETDSAVAYVTVFAEDATARNEPPRPRGLGTTLPPPQPLRVTRGDTNIVFRALQDWRDPEGDPLVLREAYMDPQWDDIVRFTADGEITYTDVGKTSGEKIIHIEVEDAHGAKTEGQVIVQVSEEMIPPTVYGDYVTTLQGESVTVEPLANDIRARSLNEVTSADCAECLKPSLADNRFLFTSDRPGTYYVDYSVNNGGTGLVRIDVLARTTNRPPVAVLDIAHVPEMGSVTIDPLLNDTDPDGDVLVIQTVSNVPDDIKITMERRTLLTIEATRELTERRVVKYRVSDGKESVEGTILVVPTPASGEIGPRVEDDTMRVRAGATGSVNVLENDVAPDGRKLTLQQELIENPFGDNAWVEDERVRVSVPAGTPPGVVQLRYRVEDSTGEARDGLLRVTVVAEDVPNMDPPQPRQVIDRLLAGTTTRIPIPLDGIDPQGDSVRLVGLGSIPKLGRVLAVGERYFEYQAFPYAVGTDTFEYVVVDTHGQQATGEVRVGIAMASQNNLKPVAVPDEVRVRPGRTAHIDPLRNDYDLDGDPIKFASDTPARMEGEIPIELVNDTELVLVAPLEEGTYSGTYDIIDERGEMSSGAFVVKVDAEAPLLPPVTRDDLVDAAALGSNRYVVVEPLLNDYDRDGPRDQLTVVVPGADEDDELAPRVTGPGEITVGVRDVMQQIRYVAVDGDGGETSGLITVPGRGDVVPALTSPLQEMTVRAGEELHITINDVVEGTHGRKVKLPNTVDIEGFPGQTKAVGDGVVSFTPNKTYWGPAVVVFKVQDIMPASDAKQAPEAFISVPVSVLRAEQLPGARDETDPDNPIYLVSPRPELLTQNPVLELGAGEGPRSIDVANFFSKPGGGRVSLLGKPHAVGGDAPIEWSVQGNSIVAQAPESARKGQFLRLEGEVVDGSTDAQTATFPLTLQVVASSFPRVSVTTDLTAVVNAGDFVMVPIGEAVVSHVPGDKSIILEGARVVSGQGDASIDAGTRSVRINAASGWNGLMTVAYTVNDVLRDPDRSVEGRITVKVTDLPPKPEAPWGVVVGDGTASIRYTSNGTGGESMVTTEGWAYLGTTRAVQGNCGGGLCTFTGLTNGQTYTVKVTDSNTIGPGPESEASEAFTPDVKLLPPQEPVVIFDNRALKLSWTHSPQWESPRGSTSDVARYILSRYKAGQKVDEREVPGGTRAFVWGDIDNGDPYSFTVRAESNHAGRNAAEFHSEESAMSRVEHPTGPPMGSVTVTPKAMKNDIGGGFKVEVNTAGVIDNGDAISQYRVVPYTSSGEHADKAATLDAQGVAEVYGMGTSPTQFRVYAHNRYTDAYGNPPALGTSPTPLVSWAWPKLTSLEVERGDGQLSIAVKHSMPAGAPGVLQYSLGDGWVDLAADGTAVVTGLQNGRVLTVSARALLDEMQSDVLTKEAMPRSAQPLPPSISTVLLDGDNLSRVTATVGEMSLIDTGGWAPASYRFCGSGSTTCSGQLGTSRSVKVPVEGGNVLWSVTEATGSGGALPVEPTTAEPPTLSGTSTVSFSFTRVFNSVCTIRSSEKRNGPYFAEGPFESANGILKHSTTIKIPQDPIVVTPTPAPTADPTGDPTAEPTAEPTSEPTTIPQPDIDPKYITVTCTINGVTTEYKLK